MSEVKRNTANRLLGELQAASPTPVRAMIEISDRCNEVCVHCYQVQGQKGEMTTEQIFGVIDDLADLGVLILTISGGEATLRKDFLDIVAHARRRGFLVRVYTNGLTMTRELASELGRLAVQTVEISLYSHRAETHDFVTGVPGSFERSVRGIRFLREAGVDVHAKTPLMSINEHEIDEYLAFVESLGATFGLDPHELLPREGRDLSPLPLSITEAGLRRALNDERLLAAPLRKRPRRDLDDLLCGAGETVQVEPNGELRPCTVLEVGLGSAVGDGGVRGARERSHTLRELRALRWRDVHGCRDCELNPYCARCHASSLAETGDALGPYPSGCAHARMLFTVTSERDAAVMGSDPTALGPYRVEDHGLRPIADEVTAADDALAERLGWVRVPLRDGATCGSSGHATPGQLVQLRRPGQKHARLTRVPGPSAAADAEPSAPSDACLSTERAPARAMEERP